MTQRTNIFAILHISDLSYVSKYDYKDDNNKLDSYFLPMPRISPGIGLEYKTLKQLSFYVEINNLLNATHIPSSFSVGLKYDIGKTTRNYMHTNIKN